MVRLINKDNVIIFKKLVSGYMQIQKYYTHIHEINNSNMKPCIYALWHSDQFCVFGIQDKAHLSILISNSADGDIVDYAVKGLGFKTVRGSSKRGGAIEGTLKMVELLEKGESAAITIDGPNGPLHTVKKGIIRIAKHSGAPIVPVCWYCPQINFLKLPSWDGMTVPIGKCNIINLYGEPIYVPKDTPQEQEVEYRNKLKSALEELQSRLPDEYKKAKSNKAWSKK